ncbi:MAG: hypothetical protein WCF94_03205 [bacterium]
MKNIAKSIAAFLVLLSVLVSTGCATTVYRGTSTEHITRIASGEVPKIGQRVIIHYSMYYEESDGPGKKVIVWEGYDDRKIHVFTTIGPAFGITDDDKGVEGALVKDPEVGAVFAKIKTE